MNSQLSLFDISIEENKEEVSEEEIRSKANIDFKRDSLITKAIKSNKNLFLLNEKVLIEYNGISYIGVVKSIYNNGETINCTFDEGRKHSAFYIENVNKLK